MSEPGTAGSPPGRAKESGGRAPRRIVLLEGGERSEVEEVLAEYEGSQVSGRRVHVELQRLGVMYPGRLVAAEWLGPLGWVRFAWCRKGEGSPALGAPGEPGSPGAPGAPGEPGSPGAPGAETG